MTTVGAEPACIGEYLGMLGKIGAPDIVAALVPLRSMFLDESTEDWLALGRGLTLMGAQTEMELLYLADTAPNALLFGLAYGKYIDALAMRQCTNTLTSSHHIRFQEVISNSILASVRERVLAKGFRFELEAEADDDTDFFDQDCMLLQSRADLTALKAQISRARSPFVLGQLLSWFLTAHRAASPAVSQAFFIDQGAENDENFYDTLTFKVPVDDVEISAMAQA